jgi:hypothetical protein
MDSKAVDEMAFEMVAVLDYLAVLLKDNQMGLMSEK